MKRLAIVAALAACGSSNTVTSDAARSDVGRVFDNAFVPDDPLPQLLPFRGVNLSGAEFGQGNVPGTFGTDYIYPDPAYVQGYASQDYFVGKHMTVFRLPFLWERLQRTLNGALDTAELGYLDTTVADLTGKGAYVIVDPHNFARYGGQVIGTAQVPDSAFADFWSKVAAHFAGNAHVIFGLMNEPHDLPTEQWRDAANAAITAIRAAGAHNWIFVPGNAYTGAWSWEMNFYGTANATVMLTITDPDDHYAFEVHQYFDSDYSGSHTTCVQTSATLMPFTQWLHDHGKRGFLGELGADKNQTCLDTINAALGVIDANKDVWLGWSWWSAGPWWGNYFMTLEPTNGQDAPQMSVLAMHL